MNDSISVSDYLEELGYARGPGAARVASSVARTGHLLANTGGLGPQMPGPGLRSVMAQQEGGASRTTDAASPNQVPKVADRMARDALNQGAGLLSGGRS